MAPTDEVRDAATPRLAVPSRVIRRLRWKAVHGATYYEIRLRRNGTTVLELWPTTASTVLPTNWRARGAKNGLVPGRYRWFVRPGFGPKVSRQYGAVVERGVFVVAKPRGRR